MLSLRVQEEFQAPAYGESGENWLKEESVVSNMYNEMRLEKTNSNIRHLL